MPRLRPEEPRGRKARRHRDGGPAVVLKVDTEAWPELAARYRVQSIPNFLVLSGGRVIVQQPGLVPATQLVAWLDGAS